MNISIIAAVAFERVIGRDNKMLWHYPKDMKRFVKITKKSGIVVMGRKTHESIGKILPGRVNVVITRDRSYQASFGAVVYHSVESAISFFDYFDREVVVIGGGEIYEMFLPYANKLYLTHIAGAYAGDSFFPAISDSEWKVIDFELHHADAKHPTGYSFVTFDKIKSFNN